MPQVTLIIAINDLVHVIQRRELHCICSCYSRLYLFTSYVCPCPSSSLSSVFAIRSLFICFVSFFVLVLYVYVYLLSLSLYLLHSLTVYPLFLIKTWPTNYHTCSCAGNVPFFTYLPLKTPLHFSRSLI